MSEAVVYVRFKIDEPEHAYTIVEELLDEGTFQDDINEFASNSGYAATVTSAVVDDLSRARKFVRGVVLALGGNDGDAAELEEHVFDSDRDEEADKRNNVGREGFKAARVSREEVLRRIRVCFDKASAAEACEADDVSHKRALALIVKVEHVLHGAPTRFRGMSYEHGVAAGLRWVLGLDDGDDGPAPDPYPDPSSSAVEETVVADTCDECGERHHGDCANEEDA